jgi:hypothetical protein
MKAKAGMRINTSVGVFYIITIDDASCLTLGGLQSAYWTNNVEVPEDMIMNQKIVNKSKFLKAVFEAKR